MPRILAIGIMPAILPLTIHSTCHSPLILFEFLLILKSQVMLKSEYVCGGFSIIFFTEVTKTLVARHSALLVLVLVLVQM